MLFITWIQRCVGGCGATVSSLIRTAKHICLLNHRKEDCQEILPLESAKQARGKVLDLCV